MWGKGLGRVCRASLLPSDDLITASQQGERGHDIMWSVSVIDESILRME